MSEIVELPLEPYRQLAAIRYLNASEAIWQGLQRQRGANNFHFLVTLRSFIGSGQPVLPDMDAKFHKALGQGKVSPLMHGSSICTLDAICFCHGIMGSVCHISKRIALLDMLAGEHLRCPRPGLKG